MKSPSITAVLKNGQWTVAYIGADAGPAKEAYTAAVNANAEGAMLFIRPEFTRRFKGEVLKAPEPQSEAKPEPQSEAQPESKPAKRKAS